MTNIIPMAGVGSRFSEAGYTLPKPLIPVSGVPMIIKAIRDMPKSDKWIFLVRKEQVDEYKIDQIIKNEIKNAIIITIDKTTEGQACTCMLAMPYVDPEEPLFIAACDNGYLYDEKKYVELCNRKDVDAIVWTFTQRETLKANPQAWGWCVIDEENMIKDMSVKIPVSNDPYNDHAVVATFYFKKAKDFIEATNLMIKENYRIKNEFYVDALPIFLKKLGKKSIMFDVDHYVGWGNPKDLHDYEKFEFICKNCLEPKTEVEIFNKWKKYFEHHSKPKASHEKQN